MKRPNRIPGQQGVGVMTALCSLFPPSSDASDADDDHDHDADDDNEDEDHDDDNDDQWR